MNYPPKSVLNNYQQNPILWIKDVLDDYPRWSKQKEVLDSIRDNRVTLVKSAHGLGKSFLAKDAAMWFLFNFYPSIVVTTAPSFHQVEKVLWAEINESYKHMKVTPGGQCNLTELKLADKWFAKGISPKIDNSEDAGKRITGLHQKHMLIIFDEAPACSPVLWEMKDTLMTSEHVRFLGIGNPVVNSGPFYEGFKEKHYKTITMGIFESPNFKANNIKDVNDLIRISKMDIEDQNELFENFKCPFPTLTTVRWAVERLLKWGVSSPLFQARVLSLFPKQSTDTIISLSALEECKDVVVNSDNIQYLGVDVARFGSDDTCIYHYKGNQFIERFSFSGQDTVKTSNFIKHKIRKDGVRKIIIDDTGLGGGVTDQVTHFVNESGYTDCNVIPVNFGSKSTTDEYDGIVTQMYYHAKEMIDKKEVQCNDVGNLFSELTSRKYEFTSRGRIKLEPKDTYKKRTGKSSPDDADAFVLCLWGMKYGDMEDMFDESGDRVF